jgi:hypothetical protein
VTAAAGTRATNLRLVYDEWDQRADALTQDLTGRPELINFLGRTGSRLVKND